MAAALALVASAAFGEANPWTATWIWNSTPREDNYFRKTFEVRGKPEQAKLAITADNIYELYVNGRKVGSDSDWTSLETYDVTSLLKPGKNVVAVKATDPGADVGALLVEMAIAYPDGTVTVVGTDKSWRISGTAAGGWEDPAFSDSGWQSSKEIGKPPVGPWGGIDHPSLAPKTKLEVVAVYWPKKANAGDTLSVTCKVRPAQRIARVSPVGLRILSHGETVCEQWIEPDVPVTKWKPGEVQRITFGAFRLPIYVPAGKLQAQVVTTATDSVGAPNIWIGPRVDAENVPTVEVKRPFVRAVDGGRRLEVGATVSGKPLSLLFALYKGDEMMFAADVASKGGTVDLPKDFPGGTYTARCLPHLCRTKGDAGVQVTIPGSQSTTWKPLGHGTYLDRDGVPHRWYINVHGALIWDGKPYVPVGAMYLSRWFMDFNSNDIEHNELTWKDDLGRLRAMKQAGVTDLYLNPCKQWNEKPAWVWQRFADMCEALGFNYGIQVTNQIKPLKAYHIAQDEYMVTIHAGGTAKAAISGTWNGRTDPDNTVLFAAFDPTTGKLVDVGRARVRQSPGGIEAEATPKPGASAELNVHFIPEFTFQGDMHDYWSGIDDAYKAELDAFFGNLELGPNMRLWIDPLDNEQSFRDMSRMLPHSPEFRAMFAAYLREKYVRVGEAVKAWAIAGAGKMDFDTLSRLVPLGKPDKDSDTGYVLDEASGGTFAVDLTKSTMWFDMLRFRDSSIAEFNNQVAEMIKRHHNVPVVLKGTDTDCFVNSRTFGGFDGIGMEAYGAAPELVRGCGGGVYARCKQSNRTMWTLVTETGLAEDYVGYGDPERLVKELGSMVDMNAKGTFYFLLAAAGNKPGEGWYIFNLFEDPRQLYWMGAFSRTMKNAVALPAYEPQVDYYFPGAMAGQQTGFTRATPSFSSDIPSQSVASNSGRWVVTSSTRIPADATRVIANLEDSPATTIYGPDFEDALKTRQVVVVGHRRNLGALSIDRYYTDRFSKDAQGNVVQALKPTPTSEVFAKTDDGTIYGLTDGNLTLYSRSGWIDAVREMAGEPVKVDFARDVLGIKPMDLGRAFQSVHFGDTTYLWNLTDSEHSLVLDAERNAKVILPDGSAEFAGGQARAIALPLPPHADRPVIIEDEANPRIEGIDTANLAAAMDLWSKATSQAKAVGIDAAVTPASGDWRQIYKLADDLQREARDAFMTTSAARMNGVSVDGDLSEWAKAQPIFLQMEVGIDYAKSADYKGARLYTGYDDHYLYVAGDVTDETIANNYRGGGIWNGDAVEVFVDLNPNARPGQSAYNDDCFQFLFSPTNLDGKPDMALRSPSLPADAVPSDTVWSVKETATGWSFEAAIGRGDLNNYVFRPGGKIGFTIQLDDSDGGDRTSVRLWRGNKNASRDRLGFGRMVLGGK